MLSRQDQEWIESLQKQIETLKEDKGKLEDKLVEAREDRLDILKAVRKYWEVEQLCLEKEYKESQNRYGSMIDTLNRKIKALEISK